MAYQGTIKPGTHCDIKDGQGNPVGGKGFQKQAKEAETVCAPTVRNPTRTGSCTTITCRGPKSACIDRLPDLSDIPQVLVKQIILMGRQAAGSEQSTRKKKLLDTRWTNHGMLVAQASLTLHTNSEATNFLFIFLLLKIHFSMIYSDYSFPSLLTPSFSHLHP